MGIAYNTSIVKSGLVLHLDAANVKSYPGSGTVWKDLSGNGNHGTLVNGPTYSTADKGNMLLDGVNDSVSSTLSSDIVGNNPWSILIFAKIPVSESVAGRQGWLIWKGPANQTANQLISMAVSSGKVEIAHWANDTVFPNADIKFDQWGMYSCTFDGSNEYVYVDSIQRGSKTTTLSVITGDLYFGSRTSTGDFLSMNVADVKVYNRALSATEIKQNFEALRGRYGI